MTCRRQSFLCLCLSGIGLVGVMGCYGRSGGVSTSGTPQVLAEQGVDEAELTAVAEAIERGWGKAAFERLVDRFRQRPEAQNQDAALWLAANALIARGSRIRAFYYLDQLLDEHPGSPLYVAAAQKQYEIADSYLRRKGDRFLFIPVHQEEEAIEMLFRLQQRLPGSTLAERAVRRTADYYFNRGDYDFAEDAYGVFIDRFPQSPDIPLVRLMQARSNILQYNGPRYDPTPLLDGKPQLEQFSRDYPDLAERSNVTEVLEWIDEQLAHKLMLHAAFYGRTGEPRARRSLLEQVVAEYPQTQQAERARRRLNRMPSSPATQPATQSDAGEGAP